MQERGKGMGNDMAVPLVIPCSIHVVRSYRRTRGNIMQAHTRYYHAGT